MQVLYKKPCLGSRKKKFRWGWSSYRSCPPLATANDTSNDETCTNLRHSVFSSEGIQSRRQTSLCRLVGLLTEQERYTNDSGVRESGTDWLEYKLRRQYQLHRSDEKRNYSVAMILSSDAFHYCIPGARNGVGSSKKVRSCIAHECCTYDLHPRPLKAFMRETITHSRLLMRWAESGL